MLEGIYSTGYKFIASAGVILLIGFLIILFRGSLLGSVLFLTGLVFGAAFIYFFRDPERDIPSEKDIILSPADGRVLSVTENIKIPEFLEKEFGDVFDRERQLTHVKIFMSPLDVHVNRNAVNGVVEKIFYKEGSFLHAASAGADGNESNYMLVKVKENNERIIVRQKAGKLARRIICNLSAGDEIVMGERFGIIQFSSGMDVYVPSDLYKAIIKKNDRVVAGESILFKMGKK